MVILNDVSLGRDNPDVGPVEAYVFKRLPLNLDLIIGLDVILRVGLYIPPCQLFVDSPVIKLGVHFPLKEQANRPESVQIERVEFDKHVSAVGTCVSDSMFTDSTEKPKDLQVEGGSVDTSTDDGISNLVVIQDTDFQARFDGEEWMVEWKWRSGPPPLNNRRCNYKVPQADQQKFDDELEVWVAEGILVPWELQRDGEVKNVLPLMSVCQQKGATVKVRPVLDFRFLNEFIENHPGAATPL
ncbi:MAG: hypothetical protein AAGJ80_15265, partial [Cyanobacteria bacterium J06553_1]